MKRWWHSHSVRVRLTLWYVAAMIVVIAVYASVVFAFVNRSASEALDQRIRGDFQWAAAMVDQTPEGKITGFEDDTVGDEERPWLQVWSPEGRLLYQNFEAAQRFVPESGELAMLPDDRIITVPTPTFPIRLLTRRGRIGPKAVIIQVARSEAGMLRERRRLLLILLLGLPLAVAVAGFGGYALAKRALAPVERMTERARTITADRLSDRLPVQNPDDEMGRLATVFNETLGRLQWSFEQMRRFTADVSHELRTPLTAIRSVGEVGLRGHRDDVAYRGIIGSMLEEADRLASLVDRLLTLSRVETGQSKLTLEDLDLRHLADNVTAHLSVLAEEKDQSITIESSGTEHAIGDRLVVRQALINLVDNAIKFSRDGGRIRIRVADSGPSVAIDVIDDGPGVSEDARPRIFDRFYRADDLDPGATGSGLGLSIAKWAVEANGGHLSLERTGHDGSTFRITLPRAAAPRQRAAG